MKNLSDQQISALIDGTADAALKAQVAANAHLQAQLDAAHEAGRRTLLLMVRSNGDPRFVALSIN